jgi:sugar phosphate isomerase/epimerase
MKFAMCNEFCRGMTLDEACALAADVGYDGIEIAPFTLADSVLDIDADGRRAIRDTVARHGLEVAGIHWLLAKPEGLHLTCPDADLRRRTVDYLIAEVDFCADIGGDRMILGSPKQRNVIEGETFEDAWARAAEGLRRLAAHAAGRGVVVCIEPLAPAETNFIQTAAEARRMVQEVNMPALRMMLDVKAMSGDVEPIPDIIRASAGVFEHFHANDANLNGPGFGETDYAPIVAALREVGYDQWVSVEVFNFEIDPDTIARKSFAYLKECFA